MNSSKRNSVAGDTVKLIALRNSLGWTQEEVAQRAGYSDRLIRKLELGGFVRASTLVDILTCYHEALGISNWSAPDFFAKPAMSSETGEQEQAHIQRLRDYFEIVFNQRKIEKIAEFIHDDIVLTAEGTSRQGRDVVVQRAEALLNAFSPINHEIESISCQAETVTCNWKTRMKHVGEFLGIAPTGIWVEARGNSTAKLEGKRFIEARDHWDVEHAVRQLKGEGPSII